MWLEAMADGGESVKTAGLKVIVAISVVAVTLVGCSLFGPDEACECVSGDGMIVFVQLEGGFYGIVADDGEHYDPLNLPAEFWVDSLRVYFEGKIPRGVGTFHMWGKPLCLFRIHRLDQP